jgi:PTS system nitrogen regulatory IIA component
MTLSDLIAPNDVLADLRVPSKARLLAELARHASKALAIAPDVLLDALTRREELGSTGLGDGIALPHARLAQVGRPFGALVRLKSPIAFDSVDDRPVDLIVLLLLPAGASGDHLNALACVARRLRDPAVAGALRIAGDGVALYAALVPGR